MTDTSNAALRPRSWEDYIGQTDLKTRLEVHLRAAIKDERRGPHVLLAGPPGIGKTTLAQIIASRLDDPLLMIGKPVTPKELASMLERHGAGVVFIDEVHRWSKGSQEDLLPLLEDAYVDLPRNERLQCPFMSVIAATTERDKVIKPLLDRFEVKPTFAPYSDDEMAQVVQGFARRLEMDIPLEEALILGTAAGGVPRHAREFVLAYRDLWQTRLIRPFPEEVVMFCDAEFDGLTSTQIAYLDVLDQMGGTAGLESMSSRMQLHPDEIRDLERLLMDRGMVVRTSTGRFLTSAGKKRISGEPTTHFRRRSA